MLVTWDTSQLDRSLLKDPAKENMEDRSTTFETSHLDRSRLKDPFCSNILLMSVT